MPLQEIPFNIVPRVGAKPSAGELNRAGKAIQRVTNLSGPGMHGDGTGYHFRPADSEFLYAQLLEADDAVPPAYSWVQVIPDGRGSFVIPGDATQGSFSNFPAYEFDGKAAPVPSYVLLYKGQGPWMYFEGGQDGSLIWYTEYLHIENLQPNIKPGKVLTNNEYIGDIAARVNSGDFGGISHLHWGLGDGINYLYPRVDNWDRSNIGQTVDLASFFNTTYSVPIAFGHRTGVTGPHTLHFSTSQLSQITSRLGTPVDLSAFPTARILQSSSEHFSYEYYCIDWTSATVDGLGNPTPSSADAGKRVYNTITTEDVLTTVVYIDNVDSNTDTGTEHIGWAVILRHELAPTQITHDIPLIPLWSRPTSGFPTLQGHASQIQFHSDYPLSFEGSFAHIGLPPSTGTTTSISILPPGIPAPGSIYFDITTSLIYVYNGSIWVPYASDCWEALEIEIDTDENDYDPATFRWIRFTRSSSPANVNITGFLAPVEDNPDGCPLLITYKGLTTGGSGYPNTITLKYDDAGSAAGNHILNAETLANDIVLHSGMSVLLRYDGTTGAYRVVSVGTGPFRGTNGSSPGTTGLVPAPSTGDQNKFLRGGGVWDTPTAAASLEIKELDGVPDLTLISVVILDQSTGLSLSQPGAGQAQITLLAASAVQWGVITTSTQIWAGDKYFNGDVTTLGNSLFNKQESLDRPVISNAVTVSPLTSYIAWANVPDGDDEEIFSVSESGAGIENGPGLVLKTTGGSSKALLKITPTQARLRGTRLGDIISIDQSHGGSTALPAYGIGYGSNNGTGQSGTINAVDFVQITGSAGNPFAPLTLSYGYHVVEYSGGICTSISPTRLFGSRIGGTTTSPAPGTGPGGNPISPQSAQSGSFMLAAQRAASDFPVSGTQQELISQPPGYQFTDYTVEIVEAFSQSLAGNPTVDIGTAGNPTAYISSGNLNQSRGKFIISSPVSLGSGLNSLIDPTSIKVRVNYSGVLTAGNFRVHLHYEYVTDVGLAAPQTFRPLLSLPEDPAPEEGFGSLSGLFFSPN